MAGKHSLPESGGAPPALPATTISPLTAENGEASLPAASSIVARLDVCGCRYWVICVLGHRNFSAVRFNFQIAELNVNPQAAVLKFD